MLLGCSQDLRQRHDLIIQTPVDEHWNDYHSAVQSNKLWECCFECMNGSCAGEPIKSKVVGRDAYIVTDKQIQQSTQLDKMVQVTSLWTSASSTTFKFTCLGIALHIGTQCLGVVG